MRIICWGMTGLVSKKVVKQTPSGYITEDSTLGSGHGRVSRDKVVKVDATEEECRELRAIRVRHNDENLAMGVRHAQEIKEFAERLKANR